MTAEVTPHHLVFTDDDLSALRHEPEGAIRRCAPPRTATRCARGSPTARSMRSRPTTRRTPSRRRSRSSTGRRPGTIGLETALAAVLTQLVEPGHRAARSRALDAMSAAPARILGADGPRRPDRAGPPGEPRRRSIRRERWVVEPPFASKARNSRVHRAHADRARPAHDAPGRAHGRRRQGDPLTMVPTIRSTRRRAADPILVLEDGTALRGHVVRRRGRDVRRGRLQHRHGRLPGGADRPLLRRADRRDDLPAPGQLRRERRGPRVRPASRSPGSPCGRPRVAPRRWRAEATLPDALAASGVVGIEGIDTRRPHAATLRERGAMRAAVSTVDLDPGSLAERVRARAGHGGRRPRARR